MNYPIYIISKGRWESRLTSRALELLNYPYRIVIEPQEFDQYSNVIDPRKILVLPFSNLGEGSIPARNWVWEHSISEGFKRHWILDDNISAFRYWNRNKREKITNGWIFNEAEKFCDRYLNVALAGFQYTMFAVTESLYHGNYKPKPFILNTRIYSCILIDNAIPFRWRGKYNEDTDLSLRVLKAGYVTILFYAFLCDKAKTLSLKGGNTDELYQGDGRKKMMLSLMKQHPDCVRAGKKWGRYQHIVNYDRFKGNRLIFIDEKPNQEIHPIASQE